jgi:CHASE2 domain-containing sensor protein
MGSLCNELRPNNSIINISPNLIKVLSPTNKHKSINWLKDTDQAASDHQVGVARVTVDGDQAVHRQLVTGAGQGTGWVVIGRGLLDQATHIAGRHE